MKKLTQVERVAQRLFREWNQEAFANDGAWKNATPRIRGAWLILAMRQIAAVKAARGTRLGFVNGRTELLIGTALVSSSVTLRVHRDAAGVDSDSVMELRVVLVKRAPR